MVINNNNNDHNEHEDDDSGIYSVPFTVPRAYLEEPIQMISSSLMINTSCCLIIARIKTD